MILPWDGDHHEKAVNTTPADMMRQPSSRNVSVLAKSNKVYQIPGSRQGDYDIITDIQQSRLMLHNTIVHGDLDDMALTRETASGSSSAWRTTSTSSTTSSRSGRTSRCTTALAHDGRLRYVVQATKELDFFGGEFFDRPGHEAQQQPGLHRGLDRRLEGELMQKRTVREALQHVADYPQPLDDEILRMHTGELIARTLFDIANKPDASVKGSLPRANKARKMIMDRLAGRRRAGSLPHRWWHGGLPRPTGGEWPADDVQ